MSKLTMIAKLLNQVRRKPKLAACAISGLLLFAAMSVPAKAQVSNTYTGMTVVHGGTIGLVPGQSVSISVPNFYLQDGSVKFFKKHTIKVHGVTEGESSLVYSGESGGLNESQHELGHIFTLGRMDLPVPGDARTGRGQFWIEIESFSASGEVRNAVVLPPSLELIDDSNGR